MSGIEGFGELHNKIHKHHMAHQLRNGIFSYGCNRCIQKCLKSSKLPIYFDTWEEGELINKITNNLKKVLRLHNVGGIVLTLELFERVSVRKKAAFTVSDSGAIQLHFASRDCICLETDIHRQIQMIPFITSGLASLFLWRIVEKDERSNSVTLEAIY